MSPESSAVRRVRDGGGWAAKGEPGKQTVLSLVRDKGRKEGEQELLEGTRLLTKLCLKSVH